jgi:hypothetical protein
MLGEERIILDYKEAIAGLYRDAEGLGKAAGGGKTVAARAVAAPPPRGRNSFHRLAPVSALVKLLPVGKQDTAREQLIREQWRFAGHFGISAFAKLNRR